MSTHRPRSGSRRRSYGDSYVAWDDAAQQYIYYCNSERNGERCNRWIAAKDMYTPAGHASGHKCGCGKWVSGVHLTECGRSDLRGDANAPSTPWRQHPRPESNWWRGDWSDSSSHWKAHDPPNTQGQGGASTPAADEPSPRATAEANLLASGKSPDEVASILATIFPKPSSAEAQQDEETLSLQEIFDRAQLVFRQCGHPPPHADCSLHLRARKDAGVPKR